MKAEHQSPFSLSLSQSLKNIHTDIFTNKNDSLTSLNNDLLIKQISPKTSRYTQDTYIHDVVVEEEVELEEEEVEEVSSQEISRSTNQDEHSQMSDTKSKLTLDRRSFYDNHKWIDEIDEEDDDDLDTCKSRFRRQSNQSNNGTNTQSYMQRASEEIEEEENLEDYQDTLSIKAQMVFKSDQSIQMENSPLAQQHRKAEERDAFDDLIDLSHRAPRKVASQEKLGEIYAQNQPNESHVTHKVAGVYYHIDYEITFSLAFSLICQS